MTSDRDATPSEVATSAWKGNIGCLAAVVMLCAFCAGATFVLGSAMDVRQRLVPWFAELACQTSGCGRLSMATIGWSVRATSVGVVTVLALVYRRRRWLFYVLLLPAVGLVGPSLLLSDVTYKTGHEPWIRDLVAEVPNGDALVVGIHCGTWAGWLALLTVLLASARVKRGSPRNVWAWQLVRLAAPLMMLPALVIAVVLA
ncbi:hypothetical protein [Micromonospora lupini]|uniref:hypothetical protein n=1 Tax=Micromonospora lupini TaxID=285679 RepID=UPI00058720E9|nr:hypothetical protein [Micromonospora lupini]